MRSLTAAQGWRDPELFDGIYQGGETVRKWRSDILLDWANLWD